ncbi:MAG: SDR family oxidoreductase [Gammaproteobacteria bacterium]|nr:SDR family oxidoreductase [Gammaproteobacteria bacterium]
MTGGEAARAATLSEEDYPLRRAGAPEDNTNAAVYLASDESPHTTGENVVVDTLIAPRGSTKLKAERVASMQKAISGTWRFSCGGHACQAHWNSAPSDVLVRKSASSAWVGPLCTSTPTSWA